MKVWVYTGDPPAESSWEPLEATGPVESFTTAASQCDDSRPATLMELRILDGAQSVLLKANLPPGLEPSIEVGQTVSVAAVWQESAWSAPAGGLSVRSETGELLLWMASGQNAAALSTPELSVEDGPAHCTVEEACGSWYWLDFDVTVGGSRAIVEYGQTARVAGYTVAHIGNEQELSSHGCSDWTVSRAAIAVAR